MSLDVWLTIKCYHCKRDESVFSQNIPHNLNEMADQAGFYKHIWSPEEIGITKAEQLIEPLTLCVKELESNPEKFIKFNSPNGWGKYEHFVPWVKEYLTACKKYPEAIISVSR